MKKLFVFLPILYLFTTCAPKTRQPENLPAPGFNVANSDAKAIAIADEVMQAMGGRKAWDDTGFLSWNFFDRRKLLWDKKTGICQIVWNTRPLSVIVNLNNGTGRVSIGGVEQTHPDSLSKYLDMGKKVWINDSYWLVMPFKMKDSGVTLKYLGEFNTEAGEAADLIQMTFSGVGVTPDNKYHVWVDKKTRLVTQWAYFEKFGDEKPALVNAWGGYKQYEKIMLSSERGSRGSLAPIMVSEFVPPGVIEKFW
ncbi:MAG: hypothetical protein IPH31_01955 [Lewinellaceae bacterium]|nr:hypothetical protein [Lewinellaceae bacterium]